MKNVTPFFQNGLDLLDLLNDLSTGSNEIKR